MKSPNLKLYVSENNYKYPGREANNKYIQCFNVLCKERIYVNFYLFFFTLKVYGRGVN